jgi:malate/lactate dehydrogenase
VSYAYPETLGDHQHVVKAGLEIFSYKGHTNYGIALSVTTIVEACAGHKTHPPVSVGVMVRVRDVCLSLPAVVVGRSGLERICIRAGQRKQTFRAARRRCDAKLMPPAQPRRQTGW